MMKYITEHFSKDELEYYLTSIQSYYDSSAEFQLNDTDAISVLFHDIYKDGFVKEFEGETYYCISLSLQNWRLFYFILGKIIDDFHAVPSADSYNEVHFFERQTDNKENKKENNLNESIIEQILDLFQIYEGVEWNLKKVSDFLQIDQPVCKPNYDEALQIMKKREGRTE